MGSSDANPPTPKTAPGVLGISIAATLAAGTGAIVWPSLDPATVTLTVLSIFLLAVRWSRGRQPVAGRGPSRDRARALGAWLIGIGAWIAFVATPERPIALGPLALGLGILLLALWIERSRLPGATLGGRR
jgi:hypothetical protein